MKHLDQDIYFKILILLEKNVSNLSVGLKQQLYMHVITLKEITLLNFFNWMKM